MIWLYRLFSLPVLVGLHFQHAVERAKVERASVVLYSACEELNPEIDLQKKVLDIYVRELEKHLERASDIHSRIMTIWHR